ncbi:MAG: radical SAM superfamily protein [uncultured bacterium]|nr:MAG: radical SAM superfamily protein [uncultured bacterium]
MKSYIFGPVLSRRLGRSLGVDVIPSKTCPFDCVYCEQGKTTSLSSEINDWVPIQDVIRDIKNSLHTNPDYITISGSGEPTLYSRLGELIKEIKSFTSIPVAVITNGALLWKREVQDALLSADLVMPSLDAGDEEVYKKINKPVKEISLDLIISGLIEFKKRYKGIYWLEVFFVEGINTEISQVKKISLIANKINPDKILINTIKRPPSVKSARTVSSEKLLEIQSIFGSKAEIIPDLKSDEHNSNSEITVKDVINLLQRRPCTILEISNGLHAKPDKVQIIIDHLLSQNTILKVMIDNNLYYQLTTPS